MQRDYRVIHEPSPAMAYAFDGAGDALEAARAYEAGHTEFYDYNIRQGPRGYTVEIRESDEGPTAYARRFVGYLEPVEG